MTGVNETMDGDFVFAKSETPREVIDLSQAKPGDVFLTREGEEYHYVGRNPVETHRHILVVGRGGYALQYTADGIAFGGEEEHPEDIVAKKPEKRVFEGWVNIDADGCIQLNESKAEAEGWAAADRIACLHIVRHFTPGEGL